METVREKTEALRDEALRELEQVEAYRTFKALDDAVAAMGGRRHLAFRWGTSLVGAASAVVARPSRAFAGGGEPLDATPKPLAPKRLSQADAAELVMREAGKPLTVRELLPLVADKGVEISAGDPVASFGSQLSRNERFTKHRREGTWYWWLLGESLPEDWNEADPDEFEGLLGSASSNSSQEGGEANAATTS